MIKEIAVGSVLFAQSVTMPYDGAWQLGDKCDISNTYETVTIDKGRVTGNGFICYNESVKPKNNDSYLVISRCYEGRSIAKYISYLMKLDGTTIYIYSSENGILHKKLTRCNG